MERISELMDGELPARECKRQIERLEHDTKLSTEWDTYHLIRDALRQEVELRPDFARRVHARIEREPTVIAPHTRLAHRVVRYTLPMAAGVAGVAVVGWLALTAQPPGGAGQMQAKAPVTVPSAAAMSDYMRAHQEFSPRTAMQGVASYVRTVSADETAPAR
jgi:negative regulator of sigma E activity